MPNFAATTSQKHQIIAYTHGTQNFVLATKIDVIHEVIEKKLGCIWDIANTKDKYLLVMTSKGHILYYDVRDGIENVMGGLNMVKDLTLNSPMQKILCELSK